MRTRVSLPKPYHPSATDTMILQVIGTYDIMTAKQLQKRLGYSDNSLHDLQHRLKRLTEHGYLQYLPFTYRRDLSLRRGGSSPLVYSLRGKGRSLLTAQGQASAGRFHVTEKRQRKQLSLEHSLRVNEVIIAAERLALTYPAIELLQVYHEHTLKSHLKGRGVPIPDAWLHFWLPALPERACLAVEVENTIKEPKEFARKLETLIPWSRSVAYQAFFGTNILQVLFLAVQGPSHRDLVLTWCERFLTATQQVAAQPLFLVAGLNPEAVTPEELFFGSVWSQPFARTPHALFRLPAAPAARKVVEQAAPTGSGYLSAPLWREGR